VSWWGSQPSMFGTRSYLKSLWRPMLNDKESVESCLTGLCLGARGGITLKTLVENSESRAFYRCLGMVEGNRSVNTFNGREEIEYSL